MELGKIISARVVIESFMDNSEMNAHLAYWMTKFLTQSQHENDFYVAEMKKIFNKYKDETNDDNEKIVIPADKVELFNKEVRDLEETDAEAPNIKFSLSELSAELKLSMRQMFPLLDFIEENQ